MTSDSQFGPVYWVVSSANDKYYVKLANYGNKVQEVSVSISGVKGGKLTVVASDDPNAANTDEETNVTPVESSVGATDGKLGISLPAWSVAVLVAS